MLALTGEPGSPYGGAAAPAPGPCGDDLPLAGRAEWISPLLPAASHHPAALWQENRLLISAQIVLDRLGPIIPPSIRF